MHWQRQKPARRTSSAAGACPCESSGDRINAVLAAAGYNFSLLLRWLERLSRLDADTARHSSTSPNRLTNAPHRFFTDDYLVQAAEEYALNLSKYFHDCKQRNRRFPQPVCQRHRTRPIHI